MGSYFDKINVGRGCLDGRGRTYPWEGGYIVLIKSVLSGIPMYFMSVFKAPKKVIKELEKLRRSFLWRVSIKIMGLGGLKDR